MYYYYAYLENGICVDIERTRRQKTDLTDYVEVTVNEYDAYMNEETSSQYYIIGKEWNGSAWVEPAKNFYAVLNEKGICVNTISATYKIYDESYVSITRDVFLAQDCLNMKYNKVTGLFEEVDFATYATADTTMISVNGQNVTLQSVIEGLQTAIKDTNVDLDANTIVSLLKTVDGSGSELDADTLDGNDSSVFAKTKELAEVKTNVEAVKTDVTEVKASLDTVKTDVVGVKTSVDDVKTGLASANTEISGVKTNVSNVSNNVSTMSTKVDNLGRSVESANANLNALANTVNVLASNTGGSVIKSIQRGVNHFNARTITLPQTVNPDKCLVIIQGMSVMDCNGTEYYSQFYCKSLTATTLTVDHLTSCNDEMGAFSWQVIEFN